MNSAWRMVTMIAALIAPAGLVAWQAPAVPQAGPDTAKEVHLGNMTQLTFGGENAEAYFSFDGGELSFQSTRGNHDCDQI